MAAITQQRPPGLFSGRRYGSFAGKAGVVLRGFKFSSTAGLELGTIVGALTGLGLSANGEAWTVFVHDDATHAIVATSGTLVVAGGAGRLPDWGHASIGVGAYFVSLRRNSDGASCSARLASEVI